MVDFFRPETQSKSSEKSCFFETIFLFGKGKVLGAMYAMFVSRRASPCLLRGSLYVTNPIYKENAMRLGFWVPNIFKRGSIQQSFILIQICHLGWLKCWNPSCQGQATVLLFMVKILHHLRCMNDSCRHVFCLP